MLDNGDPCLVGESRLQPEKPDPLELSAFAHRYNPDGSLDPDQTWTSQGTLDSASAYAVTPDRDNGLLVSGWSSVALNAPPQATVFAFGELLEEAELYMAEVAGPRIAKGVMRLHAGDLVVALDVDGTDQAQVRGVTGLFGPPDWVHDLAGGGDTSEVSSLLRTSNGHILVFGTHRKVGSSTMFLSLLHP